tara:strand:- start:146 stop:895 length:750 start_codon:yes stop_codon:yes gene_type:complete
MPESVRQLKGRRKIVALTAYDYPMAQILSEVGIDVILVGDSLGMVVLGYENTHFVTMNDMIRHTQAVMRGHTEGLVVADMPKGSFETKELAIKNVERMVEETGVRAIKIEGRPEICRALVEAGFAVMGHTGLKPQEAEKMGMRGKNEEEANNIFEEAKALEEAGCFSVVLECVPADLAKKITDTLAIPTIGIGAGSDCDGQVLVTHDLLGLFQDFCPKFAKRYVDLRSVMKEAILSFKDEVERGIFPSP